jgi:CBS domain-containing protein
MDARGVGSLVVVDRLQKPVGVVTDRDIVMRMLRRRGDPDATPVSAIMQRDPTVVREVASVDTAVRMMSRDGVRRLPVVDESGRLAGILTVDDALQLAASEVAGLAEAVRAQFPADLDPRHALGTTRGSET